MKYSFSVKKDPRPYEWHEPQITGAKILELAGFPPCWVVNRIADDDTEDTEIATDEFTDISDNRAIFTVRNPRVGVK